LDQPPGASIKSYRHHNNLDFACGHLTSRPEILALAEYESNASRYFASMPIPLLYRAEVAVEPGEGFLKYQIRIGWEMASIPMQQLFVRFPRAQQPKHRKLTRLDRTSEIRPAVDHERGNPEAWKEIEGICFRQKPASIGRTTGAAEHLNILSIWN
jgi:hypothetical protein